MHLVPFKLLCRELGIGDLAGDSDHLVTIPQSLFRLLLQAILETRKIDDASYRRANPDVSAAIQAGRVPSAFLHYTTSGYFEGRSGAEASFDEAWYLARYPDVQDAVASQAYTSGREHYEAEGALEWRSPNAAAEADLHRWFAALMPTSYAPHEEGPARLRFGATTPPSATAQFAAAPKPSPRARGAARQERVTAV